MRGAAVFLPMVLAATTTHDVLHIGIAFRTAAFSSSTVDAIAAGERDLPALKGWRMEAFGEDALRLCKGEIALTARGNEVRVVKLG